MSDEEQTIEELLAARDAVHGPFLHGAVLANRLKESCRESLRGRGQALAPAQAEAIDAILGKISRIVVGNSQEPDHWRDIAGYALLGKRDCP